MTQPSFWCVANLGDVDPFEHGGQFVCVDRTGVYPPELVVIEAPSSVDAIDRLRYSIQLERLTAIKNENGEIVALSDNKFHADKPAWFGSKKRLHDVAGFIGRGLHDFIGKFLSGNPKESALAYKALSDYVGYENFDPPATYISADEAKIMCDRFLEQIEETKNWHQGYFTT